MWLVLARWGGTVSGRQSAVLSHRPVQELSGHLCTAVKGLAFLEGEEEGGTPTISLAFFFLFGQSYTGKRLGILPVSVGILHISAVIMLLCMCGVCARAFVYAINKEHCPRLILGMTNTPLNPPPHLTVGKKNNKSWSRESPGQQLIVVRNLNFVDPYSMFPFSLSSSLSPPCNTQIFLILTSLPLPATCSLSYLPSFCASSSLPLFFFLIRVH